jgi:hypothetical protein
MGTENKDGQQTGDKSGQSQGDQSGAQGSGDGQSQGQGSQQGGGDQGGGSNMEPEGGDGGQGGGDGGNGQSGDGQNDKPITASDLAKLLDDREKKQFDRLADSQQKQLTGLLKKAGVIKDDDGGKGGQGQGQGQSQSTDDDRVRAEADRKRLARDARSSFKDILGDEVKFLGNAEREAAMTVGSALIAQAVAGGEDDEEKIGADTAKVVKSQLETLRKFYEERTLAGLKRKGLLVETPGQRPQGGTQPQMDAAFAAGRDRAASMFKTGEPKK